jgi:hypothetical protein
MNYVFRRSKAATRSASNALMQRIDLVQRWCAVHVDANAPAHCFRHRELLPDAALSDGFGRLSAALLATPDRLIAHIAARQVTTAPAETHAGRWLLYDPARSLCDGAAAAESNGYVDDDNAPPWDTWIAWLPGTSADALHGSLLAWVPDIFCAAVESGINVNPEQCIGWLG